MSWLSEFLHSPLDYVSENPLKALALLAAPAAAIAAPFAFPALGGALGIGAGAGAGAAAGGAGAAGAGILGAEAGGLLAAGGGAGGLAGGAGAGAGGLLGGADLLSSLGLGEFGADALGSFASAAGESGGAGFMPDFDWASRMFAGSEFANAAGGGAGAGLGGAGEVAGLSGIITDPLMAGAPMAGSADALAFAGGAAEPGFWSNLGTSALNSITKNPLGIAMAGGGLAYNMLQGQQKSPEMEALAASAAGLNDQGKQLMSYLTSGTLPPGLQSAVGQATASMKARIISNHARNGQSTNPSQNSALAQELNAVDMHAVTLIAEKGQQLLQSGLSATNMSTQLYGMLENMNRQSSQRMGQAIANFAAALSGPRINVNVGGQRQAA